MSASTPTELCLHDCCDAKVTRFDSTYPMEDPNSFVVAFMVTCKRSGRSRHADVVISYSDTNGLTDEEVVSLAWTRLAAGFEEWFAEVSAKPHIVGSAFSIPAPAEPPASA